MESEKIREEFEAWHGKEVAMLVLNGNAKAAYSLELNKDALLYVWQASRESLVIDIDAAKVLDLIAENDLWKRFVGLVGATIPLAEVVRAMKTEQAMADYFKALHAERDQLKAENKRLAALLECAQGDLKQAMQIIEKNGTFGFGDAFYQVAERLGVTGARPVSPMQVFAIEVLPALDKVIRDAQRYQFLRIDVTRGGDTDFCIVKKFWKAPSLERIISLEDADNEIDAAMSKVKVIFFSTPSQPLPPGCWEWVVPKGTKAPCRTCSGFGTIETGIDEAPSTICNACNGTGEEP